MSMSDAQARELADDHWAKGYHAAALRVIERVWSEVFGHTSIAPRAGSDAMISTVVAWALELHTGRAAATARAEAAERERERLDKLVCAAEQAAGRSDVPIDVAVTDLRMQLAAIPSAAELADTNTLANAQRLAALERIASAHHTEHCIARQSWGDGACECKPSEAEENAKSWTHGEVDQILRNSGVDTECPACAEVAFTGSTTAGHTCKARVVGTPMSPDVLRGAIKEGDEVRVGKRWYLVLGQRDFGGLHVREIPERPESRSQINRAVVEEIRTQP